LDTSGLEEIRKDLSELTIESDAIEGEKHELSEDQKFMRRV